MATELRWGIIGTGNIARKFAAALPKSKTGKLTAVGSRTLAKAQKFASEFNIPKSHGSYEALLADADVQAVYISTPHPQHPEWAIKAARAGKHVLCEKPIGVNHAQAMAIIGAARAAGVMLMEAYMYRTHPQTARLVELIRDKAVGDVRVIKASFSFHAGFNAESRLFKNDLAGGGILDVGGYPVSMARLIAGVATGGTVAEPTEVKGVGRLGQTGIDEWTVAVMKFPGDILASVGTGIALTQDNTVQVFGTQGSITVPWPWIPAREGGEVKIIVAKNGQPVEEIVIKTDDWLYALEADAFAAGVENRQASFPAMTWDDTLGNARALDMWRESIGLTYEMEKPGNVPTITGEPLAVARPTKMKYAKLPGLDKQVSRLVMGADNQVQAPRAAVMFDDYFARGGNCFDTAYIYAGGRSEQVLGAWVKSRGIRKDVIILDKGAHTPFCTPEAIISQHAESLQRLGTDYVDIYMMHRDNLDVPAGEFIEVMNQLVKAGTVKVFGVSNWTLDRVKRANDYAKRKGLAGIAAVSNNFSLAEMIDPVWGGCLHNSDKRSREWFKRTQTALMPWSSQGRGFFTDRAGRDKLDDKELSRCWYSPDNFRRRDRAYDLAARKGVEPVAIALAWVLHQPFPTFPLIGPRTLGETKSSFTALDIELAPKEVKWLNLEI
jgi:predicted dehydrogenase/aryl-alcohol dehydrogenase-like predicted oxidoreductase